MLFLSRYQIKRNIGGGGRGTVFLAWDQELERNVAIKRLRELSESAEQNEIALKEARAMAAVQHNNIVTLYDSGHDEQGWYFIMEYMEGMGLNLLARTGIFPEEYTLIEVARQILQGLAAAHSKGITHGDLKPGNMVVGKSATGSPVVKIFDFGLAGFKNLILDQEKSGPQDADTDFVLGSIRYISPEQLNRQPADPRSDLYALGQLLYFYASGSHASSGKNTQHIIHSHLHETPEPLKRLRPDLSPKFIEWVEHLMEKVPTNRPQSSEEALESLNANTAKIDPSQTYPSIHQALSEETIDIDIALKSHAPVIPSEAQKSKLPIIIAIVIISLLAGATFWLTQNQPENPPQKNITERTIDRIYLPTEVKEIKAALGETITLEGSPKYIKQNPQTLDHHIYYTENAKGTVPLIIPAKIDTNGKIKEKLNRYINQPIRVSGRVSKFGNNFWITVSHPSSIHTTSAKEAASTKSKENEHSEIIFSPNDTDTLKLKAYHLVTIEGTITEFKRFREGSAIYVYLSEDRENTVTAVILPESDPDRSIEKRFRMFYQQKVRIMGRVQIYEDKVRILIKEESTIEHAPQS
ncbi:MAG: serine/threonine-protein kinase [Verrucomicrobiota bacterium]